MRKPASFIASLLIAVVVLSTLTDTGASQRVATGRVAEIQSGAWMRVVNDQRDMTVSLSGKTRYESGDSDSASDPAAIKPGTFISVWYRSVAERRPLADKVRVLPASAARLSPREQQWNATLAEIFVLCRELLLPNSMARAEGVDDTSHLAEVDARRKRMALVFHYAWGVDFLASRIRETQDDVARACMFQILSETRRNEAAIVLKKYASISDPRIAASAQRFLDEMQRK